MAEPLKLVPEPEIDLVEDSEETLKTLDDYVDQLTTRCDDLLETEERIRLALSLSKVAYVQWRDRGFDRLTMSDVERESLRLKLDEKTRENERLRLKLDEMTKELEVLRKHVATSTAKLDQTVAKLEKYLE